MTASGLLRLAATPPSAARLGQAHWPATPSCAGSTGCCSAAAIALSAASAPLLVYSATRSRTELTHGDPYYFLLRHAHEHRHRLRPDGRHGLARPPHPARRRAGPLRPLGAPGPRGAHPAGRHDQRRARLDRASAAASRSSPPSSSRSPSSWAWRCCWPPGSTRATSVHPDHRTVAPGAGPGRRPDADRHADAGPRLGHGHGRHRARRAARLRRLQPLGLRPARRRRGRRRR